jgi:hypothetical protein
MSKPKRILIGTSRKGLKGFIRTSNFSHSSGMKGVMMGNRLDNDVALLGSM